MESVKADQNVMITKGLASRSAVELFAEHRQAPLTMKKIFTAAGVNVMEILSKGAGAIYHLRDAWTAVEARSFVEGTQLKNNPSWWLTIPICTNFMRKMKQ